MLPRRPPGPSPRDLVPREHVWHVHYNTKDAAAKGHANFHEHVERHRQIEGLERYFARFTILETCTYAARVGSCYFIFYSFWAVLIVLMEYHELTAEGILEAALAMKILTFLVGLLISFELREGISRYKECLTALVDFCEELRSFWYFAQLNTETPAERLILDVHMVFYSSSLARFLLVNAGLKPSAILEELQEEYKRFSIFWESSLYAPLGDSPILAEVLLLSWLTACGVLDGELKTRFRAARTKVKRLMTSQRVQSPRTSSHLMRATVHGLLIAIPVCCHSWLSKLMTPLIAFVLLLLLQVAEELEDPFGVDTHDIPWPEMLSVFSRCSLSPSEEEVLDKTVKFFNEGCVTGEWDQATAKQLFGDHVKVVQDAAVRQEDCWKRNLGAYLTEPKLRALNAIGVAAPGGGGRGQDGLWSDSSPDAFDELVSSNSDDESTAILSHR